MDHQPTPTQGVSRLHSLWLLVFAWEAFDGGRGLSHQLGGAALGALLAFLVGTEIRSHRKADRVLPSYGPPAFGAPIALVPLPLREQDLPRTVV